MFKTIFVVTMMMLVINNNHYHFILTISIIVLLFRQKLAEVAIHLASKKLSAVLFIYKGKKGYIRVYHKFFRF